MWSGRSPKPTQAFASWFQSSPANRRDVFLKATAVVDGKGQKLAAVMTSETGGTFGWGTFNAGLAANILREAAAAVAYPLGQVLATDTPGALSLAIVQPHRGHQERLCDRPEATDGVRPCE
jgi:acyl-CoA reductase-like NAD-dependent aldehyde dehydrogenase